MLEAKEAGLMMENLTSSVGKIAFALIGAASAVLLASLVDLRISSSLLRLWITSQLIILVIWKFSADITSTPSPYHYLEQLDYLSAVATDSPEETDWYSSESSPPLASAQHVDPPAVEDVKNDATTAATTAREESTSMDDAWKAILEGSGRRPVLTKCETWKGRGSAEAEAERAVAALRRSDTTMLLRHNDEEVGPAAAAGKRRRRKKKRAEEEEEEQAVGWRWREKLVVSQDELFQRVETFIKKHHDHLRLQRQESEQRRLVLETRELPSVVS